MSKDSQSASIEGVVIDEETAKPIAGALVELSGVANGQVRTFRQKTAGDGRFAFREILPGSGYWLTAMLGDGYVTVTYAQRNVRGQDPSLTLTPGQELKDIQFAMVRTGQIFGQVLDSVGKPIRNARVEVLQAAYEGGQKVLRSFKAPEKRQVTTDANGTYRLLGLPPGQYYLSAIPPSSLVQTATVLGNLCKDVLGTPASTGVAGIVLDRVLRPTEAYLPVFFPGTIDSGLASPVRVAPGQESGPKNLVMTPSAVRSVMGEVLDRASGERVKSATVVVLPLNQALSQHFPCSISVKNGRFDVPNIVSGSYLLLATGTEPSTRGYVSVDVTKSDARGVQIFTAPDLEIRGRIIGGPLGNDGKLAGVTITLHQPLFTRILAPIFAKTFEDGTFTLNGFMEGDYRLNVGLPAGSENWYVRSFRFGTTQSFGEPLQVNAGPFRELEILMDRDGGSMKGSVVDSEQRLVNPATVVLVPDERHRLELYRRAVTDEDGAFSIRGLRPGAYKVFAWENVQDRAWEDPHFLSLFEAFGQVVRIDESTQATVRVVLPPGV